MRQSAVWSVDRRFPQHLSSVHGARVMATSVLSEHELPHLVDDITLVVSELVTNVLVHAETPVRVVVEGLPFCVRLSVFDESPDLPIASRSAQVDSEDESGRGLWITDACSAAWGVDEHDSEKCVWAIFAVRPKPAGSAEGASSHEGGSSQLLHFPPRTTLHPPEER